MTGRRRLGLALLAAAGAGWFVGAVRFGSAVLAGPELPPPALTATDKFLPLLPHLPARGQIGYRTVRDPGSFGELVGAADAHVLQRAFFDALLAQQALAPRILQWRDDLEWTVGNYLDDRAIPSLPAGIGVVELLRPGHGLVLYRRR